MPAKTKPARVAKIAKLKPQIGWAVVNPDNSLYGRIYKYLRSAQLNRMNHDQRIVRVEIREAAQKGKR